MKERESYISKEAKIEQKIRMEQQVSSVRDKVGKWANTMVFGGYYKGSPEEYNEGDVWEDNDGKKWTVKNGIKQSVTKLRGAKTPWWCPKCGRSLNAKIHEKFYNLRGTCHDCVVTYEGKMRIDGVWEAYERRVMLLNEQSWLNDKIAELNDYIVNFKTPQLHFSDGRWEELATKSMFNEEFDRIRSDIQFYKDRLKQIEIDKLEDSVNQEKLIEWEKLNPWTTESTND